MKCDVNTGKADRIARVIIGAGVLSLAFVGPATPWAYLGLIPLVTGVAGRCPLYRVMGMSTCARKS